MFRGKQSQNTTVQAPQLQITALSPRSLSMPSKAKPTLKGTFGDLGDIEVAQTSAPRTLSPTETLKDGAGKKPRTKEGFRQTTMILRNDHISWLVGKVAEASARGVVTNKTDIIEILIDLAKEAGVSLAELDPTKDTASQIRARLVEKLSRLA